MTYPKAEWHNHYHVIVGIIIGCLVYMVSLVIIQSVAVKWYNEKHDINVLQFKSIHTLCIYGVYTCNILCSFGCLFCHVSFIFDEIYCIIGAPFCTILYGAARCFLYGVWLERAKILQTGYIAYLPNWFMNKILPLYIGLYYFLQVIIIGTFFRGKLVTDSHNEVTSCHFDEWVQWVPIIATFADGFNAIFFLLLFIYPFYQNFKHTMIDNSEKQSDFISLIKKNASFTIICSLSSMATIVIIADRKVLVPLFIEYIWLITNIDMFINGTFLFLIFKPNQEFLYEIICRKKSRKVTETTKIEMDHHIAVATPTSAWSSKENMPFPDVKIKSSARETLHLSSDNETHE